MWSELAREDGLTVTANHNDRAIISFMISLVPA